MSSLFVVTTLCCCNLSFFQAIFHHFFVCLMKDLGQHLLITGQFALEIEESGRFKFVYVRFWKDDNLVKVFLCRYGVQSPPLAGELGALSRILSVVSTRPQFVACSGFPVDFVQTVDDSGIFKRTLQSPFRFESVDLQTIMHRDSHSVFQRIDFFSVLQGLIVSLGGSLTCPWTLECPELSKVMYILCHVSSHCHQCSIERVYVAFLFFFPRPLSLANLTCCLCLTCAMNC